MRTCPPRPFRHWTVVTSLALALAAPALAAVEEYEIDPAHSDISFSIRHFFTRVPGSFQKFSGSFAYDPADPSTAKVQVEIDPASIFTNQPKRDTHLKSADFFDVEKLPKMTFEGSGATAKGPDEMTVKGNLTMHGVTKPVELQVKKLGALNDPWGNYRASFEGRATVNRKEFGIVWNKALDSGSAMLGDEVDVTINIEATRKKAEAKEGKPAASDKK